MRARESPPGFFFGKDMEKETAPPPTYLVEKLEFFIDPRNSGSI
jgi:hypothetical protein